MGAKGTDKEKSVKCEVNVKSAQTKLEVKFKAMKKQSTEVSTKVEFNVKTEKKDKYYLKKEKQEKAYEAGYKWYEKKKAEKSQKTVSASEVEQKRTTKIKAQENLNK